ncbi:MAG: hypothetical protein KTR25_15695 [Myxococcales bacterium]|nr:hypothetical protein [Myxococcales bacterium]
MNKVSDEVNGSPEWSYTDLADRKTKAAVYGGTCRQNGCFYLAKSIRKGELNACFAPDEVATGIGLRLLMNQTRCLPQLR